MWHLSEREGAHRVQASTDVENTGMRRVLDALGFVDEGPPRSFTPMTERTAPRSRDARNDREQLDEEPLRWTRTS